MATRRVSELDSFLSAPAVPPKAIGRGGGGWTNYDIVVAVCGVRGPHVRDQALFDAVSLKYGRPCETFAQAFRECMRGRRSLARLDIATLRECHPAFAALQLPPFVEEAQIAAEIGTWFERQAAEAQGAAAAPPVSVAELERDLARVRAEQDTILRDLARVTYIADLGRFLEARRRRNERQAQKGYPWRIRRA